MTPPKVAARRARVLELFDGVRTKAEIARMVGATKSQVVHDVDALKASGHVVDTKRDSKKRMTHDDIARLAELRQMGIPRYRIASMLGFTEATIRKHWNGPPSPKAPAGRQDVVRYADGGYTAVSHGRGAESARRMALAMSRGRDVVSHTVEAI